jgi:hypothetical protein
MFTKIRAMVLPILQAVTCTNRHMTKQYLAGNAPNRKKYIVNNYLSNILKSEFNLNYTATSKMPFKTSKGNCGCSNVTFEYGAESPLRKQFLCTHKAKISNLNKIP